MESSRHERDEDATIFSNVKGILIEGCLVAVTSSTVTIVQIFANYTSSVRGCTRRAGYYSPEDKGRRHAGCSRR